MAKLRNCENVEHLLGRRLSSDELQIVEYLLGCAFPEIEIAEAIAEFIRQCDLSRVHGELDQGLTPDERSEAMKFLRQGLTVAAVVARIQALRSASLAPTSHASSEMSPN